MKRLTASALLVAALAFVSPAGAQQMTMLAPLASEYVVGGFQYTPPGGGGWRQLAESTDGFRLVYADKLPDEKINMRAELVAQAFEIPDPALTSDALSLARVSQSQQLKKMGDALVAFSAVKKVADDPEVGLFTLVSKAGDVDAFETFAVALAPDKSAYLVAKLTTREKQFRDAPYYKGFVASLGNLEFHSTSAKRTQTEGAAVGQPGPGGKAQKPEG
jgi:hypothetical protein